jgi:hypothetical protein
MIPLLRATNTFERDFLKTAEWLCLNDSLNAAELCLLCQAAFYSALCNIAFNGLAGCRGEIRPDREAYRIILEQAFMAARDRCYACLGWTMLSPAQIASVDRIFLNVFVNEENLAP